MFIQSILQAVMVTTTLGVGDMLWGSPQAGKPSASEPRGTVLIDFHHHSKYSKDRWVVRALEQNLKRDLEVYPSLRIVPKTNLKLEDCDGDISCRLARLKEQGVDIYLDGVGIDGQVYWDAYHTLTGIQIVSGVLKTGRGASHRKLKMEAYKAVSAFLVKGGIFDQLDLQQNYVNERKESLFKKEKLAEENFSLKGIGSNLTWSMLLLIIFTAFVCLYILAVMILRIRLKHSARQDFEEQLIREQKNQEQNALMSIPIELNEDSKAPTKKNNLPLMKFKSTYLLILSYLVTLGLLGFFKTEYLGFNRNLYQEYQHYFQPLVALSDEWLWLTPALTGFLWGVIAIKLSRLLFPSLAGFEQLHPAGVFSTLKSWLLVSIVRILVVALVLLPPVALASLVIRVFDIEIVSIMSPILPMTGLIIWAGLGITFDLLALYFDCEAVHGLVGSDNRWNSILHQWLDHWVETQPYSPDLDELKHVVFLPGKTSDLVVYGGGFSRPRIVINESLLYIAFHGVGAEDFSPRGQWVRDFLAGVILLGLAQVHRYNHWLHCLTLLVRKVRLASPRLISNSWDMLEELLWPYYSRSPVRLLDSYVCSHGCLDQLVQFLGYQLWREPNLLTTGADKLRLRQQTRDILERAEKDKAIFELFSKRTLRGRLMWIKRFTQSSADDVTKNIRIGWRAFGLALGLSLVFLSYHVKNSWDYNEVYEVRILNQKKDLLKKIEKNRRKYLKKNINHEPL